MTAGRELRTCPWCGGTYVVEREPDDGLPFPPAMKRVTACCQASEAVAAQEERWAHERMERRA